MLNVYLSTYERDLKVFDRAIKNAKNKKDIKVLTNYRADIYNSHAIIYDFKSDFINEAKLINGFVEARISQYDNGEYAIAIIIEDCTDEKMFKLEELQSKFNIKHNTEYDGIYFELLMLDTVSDADEIESYEDYDYMVVK